VVLLVLLAWPWMGRGGSAHASFALRRLDSSSERTLSAGFALFVTVDGEEAGSCGASFEDADEGPRKQGAHEWADLLSPALSAWPGFQTSSAPGGMSTSGSPSGPGGPGPIAALTGNCPPLGLETAERLLLDDDRFNPPPFASRLFRPPR
jgi:hypothetical protein